MLRLLERIAAAWALAGGGLVLAIMLVTSWNAGAFALDRLARPFGGAVAGLPGYEDFVRLAISCAGVMFLPWCQWMRGHVAVDLLASRLPRALRSALERLWLGGTALLALFLAYWMSLGMIETRGDAALSPVLGWPLWPFFAPGIVSLGLWALVAGVQAARPGLSGARATPHA